MNKTTYLFLFLLFFSNALSVLYAQTPSDENFDDNTTFDVTSNDFTLDGVRYQISGDGITYRHITSNSTFNLSEDGANDYALQFDINGNGGISSITISASDGSAFQIAGMSMDILSSASVQFTSDNGGSFNLNPNDGAYVLYQNYDFTAQSGFDNITTLTISGLNMVVDIDDLNFEPAVSPATAPTVTTSAASSITATGATLNGDVTSDGGATVTTRGFVYSSSNNTPTIGETGVTQVTDGSGTGVFDEDISGLSSSTTYYYQAYATNSEGTSYGGVESFTTQVANAPPIVDVNTGLMVSQGTTGNIDSGKLHFNDDETEDDAQLTATITTAVAHGILFLDVNLNNTLDLGEEELIVNSTFTQDDVNNERIRYTSTVANETSDSFVFKVTDSDGGELSNQTFNITINQIPTVTVNNGLTLDEGTTELIDSGKLNANDAESGGGSDITFTITSAVSHGILFIDSNPSTVFEAGDIELIENATFTLDDINNDKLRYTNTVGNQTTDSFEFKVSDPDGGELANQTFTIIINLLEEPTVTTAAPIDVTTTTATLGGEVTNSGSSAVTERGIVYNITGTPTITDSKIQIGSGIGSFAQEIIALTAGTTYYMRAYATNAVGTSYGNEESFITSALAIDDNQIKNAISLYPNPVNNLLYINNHIIKVDKVSLFDVFGKRIDGIKIENQAINLSKIKTGIYLLKIETDRGNVVKRIVKE